MSCSLVTVPGTYFIIILCVIVFSLCFCLSLNKPTPLVITGSKEVNFFFLIPLLFDFNCTRLFCVVD